METIQKTNRLHPLVAAAAVSVIVVSLAGAAAITGILPSSHSAPEPQQANAGQLAAATGAQSTAGNPAQPGAAATQPGAANSIQPNGATVTPAAPVAAEPVAQQAAPAPKKTVEKTRVVHHYHNARDDSPTYAQQPAPAPAAAPAPSQPNYLAIGTGAVIGGLVGNQIGGGNGKKLATVAGVIGGGMIGNEISNRNR
jgi:hypothetical protein